MAALHKRALYRLMLGGSVVAFVPTLAHAQTAPPPPVNETQQTEEQRPDTANTTAAEAPPGTAGNDIVITGIRGSYPGIMGLPLYETAQLLRACGLQV